MLNEQQSQSNLIIYFFELAKIDWSLHSVSCIRIRQEVFFKKDDSIIQI